MTRKEEAEIRNISAEVITKMQTMQVADEVIANKLLEFDLIDEDEHKTVVEEFSLEPYDTEEEPNNNGEELNMDEKVKGTYVSANIKNNKEVYDWFKNQGVDMEDKENLHCTISFSRKEFNHIPNMEDVIVKQSDFIGIEPLGDDGATVLKFNSEDMQKRFNKCMSDGATYDYDSYIPHITLTYNGKYLELDKIKMPNFDLILGSEKVEPLDLEWKEKTSTYSDEQL